MRYIYQNELDLVYKFFDKKSKGTDIISKDQQFANELHKPIIRKIRERKIYWSYGGKIWGGDLADMQLISRYNEGIKFLLCIIGIYNIYAWVVPLKDKKDITITMHFKFFWISLFVNQTRYG